jgi:hypothetical protein
MGMARAGEHMIPAVGPESPGEGSNLKVQDLKLKNGNHRSLKARNKTKTTNPFGYKRRACNYDAALATKIGHGLGARLTTEYGTLQLRISLH